MADNIVKAEYLKAIDEDTNTEVLTQFIPPEPLGTDRGGITKQELEQIEQNKKDVGSLKQDLVNQANLLDLYSDLSNEEYEFGSLGSSGALIDAENQIRTKNFIELNHGDEILCDDNYSIRIYRFSNAAHSTFLDRTDFIKKYDCKNNCFVKVVIKKDDGSIADIKFKDYIYYRVYKRPNSLLENTNENSKNIIDLISKTRIIEKNISVTIKAKDYDNGSGTLGSDGNFDRHNTSGRIAFSFKVAKGTKITITDTNCKFAVSEYSKKGATSSFTKYSGVLTFKDVYIVSSDAYCGVSIYNINGDDANADILDKIVINTGKNKLTYKQNISYEHNYYLVNNGKQVTNIDLASSKIVFPGDLYIIGNNTNRYTIYNNVEVDITNFKNTTGMLFVVYDEDANSIRCISSAKNISSEAMLATVTHSCVLLLSITFSEIYDSNGISYKYISSVNGASEYTICGLKPEKYYKSLFCLPIPCVLSDLYICDNTKYTNVDNMQYTDIYNGYDRLVDTYPNNITKTLMGQDSSGQYPIYQYHFKPDTIPFVYEDDPDAGITYLSRNVDSYFKKIIIICGVHGSEKPSQLAMLNLMDAIWNNWEKSDALKFLRFHTEFIIIPVANPWGFENNARTNANRVDINRNFNTSKWINGDETTENDRYRGEKPASEKETQYIQKIIEDNSDALVCLDVHSHGLYDAWNNMYRIEIGKKEWLNEWIAIANQVIVSTTYFGWQSHELNRSSGYICKIGVGSSGAGVDTYANDNGLFSATPEVAYRFLNGNNNDNNVEKMNVEFIANAILCCCHQFN